MQRSGEEKPFVSTSWVPMIVIALGQVIMSYNVAALPVSLSGMVKSFSVPPTTVATDPRRASPRGWRGHRRR